MRDYELVRQETRSFWLVTVALVTVGATALGAGLVLWGVGHPRAPARVWAFVPLLPTGVSGLIIQQMAAHNVHSVYERVLERRIQRALEPAITGRKPTIPSYSHLMRGLFEFAGLPLKYRPIPALQFFFFVIIGLLNLGVYLESLSQITPFSWRLFMFVVYPVLWVLLFAATVAAFDLPDLWTTTLAISEESLRTGRVIDEVPTTNLRNPSNWKHPLWRRNRRKKHNVGPP